MTLLMSQIFRTARQSSYSLTGLQEQPFILILVQLSTCPSLWRFSPFKIFFHSVPRWCRLFHTETAGSLQSLWQTVAFLIYKIILKNWLETIFFPEMKSHGGHRKQQAGNIRNDSCKRRETGWFLWKMACSVDAPNNDLKIQGKKTFTFTLGFSTPSWGIARLEAGSNDLVTVSDEGH